MPRDPQNLKIFISAGEASGDALGARLMAALKKSSGATIEFSGIGGALMEQEGLASIFPMNDLSVMGLAEVLPRLNKILRRIKQASDYIIKNTPDIVITIDAPDFNFRVAKQVQDSGKSLPKMVHYVAPTVWAWRPERAKKVAGLYDGIMCLFPMEPPYFEAEGMKAAFVGHSMLENAGGNNMRRELGIAEDTKVLGVLFGSRLGEINRTGPILREAAYKIAAAQENTVIVSLTLPHLQKQVQNLLEEIPCKTHLVSDIARKWDVMATMDAAIATSGTVGLELAVANVPHVIGYKVNLLTWLIARKKINISFAHLVNILLDRAEIPEFLQNECRPDLMSCAVLKLLNDPASMKAQTAAFQKVRRLLKGANDQSASEQAANFIMDDIYLRSPTGT